MLCSRCKKNTAVIFINTTDAQGNQSQTGYCYNCAKELGLNPLQSIDNSKLSDEEIKNLSNQLNSAFKDVIEKDKNILAIRYRNSIRSLKHRPKKSGELKFLDMTSEDGKMIYIRGLLYILCMAINRLYPNAKIRTEYQLHNAMYINITNLELTDYMVKDIEEEMKDIVDKNYEIIKKAFTKEEAEEFYMKNRSLRGMLQKDVKNEVKLYFCDRIFQLFLWCNANIYK